MSTKTKSPAFLFYPGDYLKDTQLLPAKAQVAYTRIMCEHINNICIRQAVVTFLTKNLDSDERDLLMDRLVETENGYQIEWVVAAIEKQRAYSESRRKNRMNKKKNISKTHDNHMTTHMENENENENVNEIEEANATEIWPTFADFWDLYDKKIDKRKCQAKWKKIKIKDRMAIMDHLELYVPATNKQGARFRRHPLTYLNNETWNNEIEQYGNNNASTDEYARTAQELGLIGN